MKGYCKCGKVIDEVEFTQFGMCEVCYKRNRVILLLLLNKSYREIGKEVKVSYSIISEVKKSIEFKEHKYLAYQHAKKYIENNLNLNRDDKNEK